MRLVFTHENSLIVGNARNILESADIAVAMRNEFASSAIGEVAPIQTWPELWVVENEDYERAVRLLDSALSAPEASPWRCNRCQEENDPSFELCWNCQTPQG